MLFKGIGVVLVLWGIADLAIGMMGGDLWARIGITLPELVWSYSHYIAIFGGIFVYSMGGGEKEQAPRE